MKKLGKDDLNVAFAKANRVNLMSVAKARVSIVSSLDML